jgi:hypothetical protein
MECRNFKVNNFFIRVPSEFKLTESASHLPIWLQLCQGWRHAAWLGTCCQSAGELALEDDKVHDRSRLMTDPDRLYHRYGHGTTDWAEMPVARTWYERSM